jgi:outer membrane protein
MKLKSLIIAASLCLGSGFSAVTVGQPEADVPEIGRTLDDFLGAAIEFSPALKIAQEGMNIGTARRKAANGQLLPQVSARANVSDNRREAQGVLTTFDGNRYSIQLSQVLFNWQAFSARKTAYFVEDQLEAEYYGELANIMTVVAQRYFDVLQAEDALDSIAQELDAVKNQLAQIESLYERQLTRITDLYQAQASVAAVEGEQLKLEIELDIARELLFSISGMSAGDLSSLSDNAVIPPIENSINYWVKQANENNHQISAREFALKAADKRVDERRGAYMPQVSIVGQLQESNLGFDNALIDQSDISYVGIDVTIPLYAGGSNRAAVSEATSQFHIAESELKQTQLEASERVRSAYLQVQSAQKLIDAASKLVESATLSSKAMQQGFELGVVTSVDVLIALRDQFAAQRDLQRARYDHVKFLLFLKREAGLLSSEDMIEVSSWLELPN